MYEYKFVRVKLGGLIESKPKQDYHEIIDRHAREGWRLVQIVTPPTGPYGTATHYEIVFEKQI